MAFLKSGVSGAYCVCRILLCAVFYRFSVKSQLAKEALCIYVSSWKWPKVCHCSVETHSLFQAIFLSVLGHY